MKATAAGRVVRLTDRMPGDPIITTKKPVVEMTVGEVSERFYAWVVEIPARVTAHERRGA